MNGDHGRTRALAKNRDTRRVATERFDVSLHPLERRACVLRGKVSRAAVGRCRGCCRCCAAGSARASYSFGRIGASVLSVPAPLAG